MPGHLSHAANTLSPQTIVEASGSMYQDIVYQVEI
ncbi:hypothetical protein SAMN05421880_103141 [Nitrosomonas nitrosa]|uniref:Uncharacterized protein n=1 Tax=Nitrosomonas nitrosa TaxID=52442 RepID=A0A1I4M713_9PROT|nr:hypothetical protein SAMN05421880_103141 [Nitrosomonas nitrosa]